jgi:hypothetical protein
MVRLFLVQLLYSLWQKGIQGEINNKISNVSYMKKKESNQSSLQNKCFLIKSSLAKMARFILHHHCTRVTSPSFAKQRPLNRDCGTVYYRAYLSYVQLGLDWMVAF